jgi:hypothetical protein
MKRSLLPAAATAVLLAGCSAQAPTNASAAPSSAAPSSLAPTAVASSAPPSSAGTSGDGCPVDAAKLQKAFQANAEVAGSIILGKGFKDISCYQGYATALTQPEAMDTAVVVFKYDTAKKSWVAVMGGTDGVCVANVPAAIRSHLKHC